MLESNRDEADWEPLECWYVDHVRPLTDLCDRAVALRDAERRGEVLPRIEVIGQVEHQTGDIDITDEVEFVRLHLVVFAGMSQQVQAVSMPEQHERIDLGRDRLRGASRMVDNPHDLAVLNRDQQPLDQFGMFRVVARRQRSLLEHMGQLVEVLDRPLAQRRTNLFERRLSTDPDVGPGERLQKSSRQVEREDFRQVELERRHTRPTIELP